VQHRTRPAPRPRAPKQHGTGLRHGTQRQRHLTTALPRARCTAYLLAATTARRPLPRTTRSPTYYFKPAQPARTRTLAAALMTYATCRIFLHVHPSSLEAMRA